MYKNYFNTDWVVHWRLAIGEYSPEILYIKGESNVVADALSRLATKEDSFPNIEFIYNHSEFDNKDLPDKINPLKFQIFKSFDNEEDEEDIEEHLFKSQVLFESTLLYLQHLFPALIMKMFCLELSQACFPQIMVLLIPQKK